MLVAGIRTLGGPVEAIEVTDPRPLAPDEVLIADWIPDAPGGSIGSPDPYIGSCPLLRTSGQPDPEATNPPRHPAT